MLMIKDKTLDSKLEERDSFPWQNKLSKTDLSLTKVSQCSATKKKQRLINISCINVLLPRKGLICKYVKKSALTY